MTLELADSDRQHDPARAPYSGSYEHLSDELKRLDVLIRLRLRERRRPGSPPGASLEMFKGLVVTEGEVLELLADGDTAGEAEAEADVLAERLGRLDSQIKDRLAASAEGRVELPLARLGGLFGLTVFERQSVLICLAPELNRKYEKVYAYLQDDVTRKKPSVDLVISLVSRSEKAKTDMRPSFHPQSPLLKYRLLRLIDDRPDSPAPLLSRSLKLDDRTVDYLLGHESLDAQLGGVARLAAPAADANHATTDDATRARLLGCARAHFRSSGHRKLVFHFHGPYGSGRREMVESVCRGLGLRLLVADLESLLDGAKNFEDAIWALGRETVLQPAALCVENFDLLLAEHGPLQPKLKSLAEAVQTFSALTFLLGNRPWRPRGLWGEHAFVEQEFKVPGDAARKLIWEESCAGTAAPADGCDWSALASKFRFTPGQIRDALAAARSLALRRAPHDPRITAADIHAACRAQSSTELGALACKVEPAYSWPDIVLPPDQTAQLRELCDQAKHRCVVFDEWGFARRLSIGKGLAALFSGPPGTGKTMAAEVIAGELGLDLYKVDLSQVVSKYIGETEKNLHHIFDEARASSAILFFDEADALFGKRSEVKDAHDRYANIEIGYLLQEMETYEGIAILATNLRQNMDEAFVRRLQVIVEFPFPDEEHRKSIWEVIFPAEAPLADDVDFGLLAREANLAGGNIKNIALAAAFYAAAAGGPVGMRHLVAATRREYQKLGRTWDEAAWEAKTTKAASARRN
jgi:hypothetical protein